MKLNNWNNLKGRRKELRNNCTDEEALLWARLKNSQLMGYKFRRQHSVGPYILDFYCPSIKIAIELDGSQHNTADNKEYDKNRDEWLSAVGIKVIRFQNYELKSDLERVLTRIIVEIKKCENSEDLV
ncbi:MAG: endonuclease domain-containing protein [Chloroflexota bacterium]